MITDSMDTIPKIQQIDQHSQDSESQKAVIKQ